MGKDPAFLFYPGDFIAGTTHLTDEEVGCYIRLLCTQFNQGPLSEKKIRRILGEKHANIWEELEDKFLKNNQGEFYNKRLLFEKNRREKFVESRSNNRKTSKLSPVSYEKHTKVIRKTHVEHMENENENENRTKNPIQDKILS